MIKCKRCKGVMVNEQCFSEGVTFYCNRCINCGNVDFGKVQPPIEFGGKEGRLQVWPVLMRR
jgi:late competence protein required for DNA uptake (superfamily II DNA/RNA helicase)